MKRACGMALVVLIFAVALPALAGCGGEAQATGGDVADFIEFLVPVIEYSKCPSLSAAAHEFETNIRDSVDFQKEARAFQRFVDSAPDEIQRDLQTFADPYSKWAAAVERGGALKGADLANPTPENMRQLLDISQGISARVDRHELQQATHNIVAWMRENCG